MSNPPLANVDFQSRSLRHLIAFSSVIIDAGIIQLREQGRDELMKGIGIRGTLGLFTFTNYLSNSIVIGGRINNKS